MKTFMIAVFLSRTTMKIITTVSFFAITGLCLFSCEKAPIDPSINSMLVSNAKKIMPVEISMNTTYPFTFLVKVFITGGETSLGRGEVTWDSCLYIGSKPSKCKVRLDGIFDNPDNSGNWTMIIEESRSASSIASIGDPYYISYSSLDQDGIPYYAGEAGPYRDTAYAGTGTWKILSSNHPLVNAGTGKLDYNSHVRWVTPSREQDYWLLTDIYRFELPLFSTLRGQSK